MTGNIRRGFLITGSIIAFIGLLLPVLYGVSYNPPANSAAATIDLSKLAGFNGAFSTTNAGVYNGFGGPLDLHITLIAIVATAILGFLAPLIDIDEGVSLIGNIHHGLSALSQVGVVGGIIWQFRSGGTPSQITQKFIADLGGGQAAIDASHYLSASLGGGFLILLVGFLVGSVGTSSWLGCLLLVGFCLVFGVLLFYTKITTGVW